MKQITQNTEFIIGIDFGHGETSAAFYDLQNPGSMDLDILPGLNVVKSAVAILEQEGTETISVGDAAIQNAPYAKDFQVSFKKRPSEMNAIERNRMLSFMKGIYEEILNRNPDFKTRDHAVYIARPSQDVWDAEEKAYLQIADDAGLPVAGIQKESRAAYFRARTQTNSKIDQQVKKGVLIVDYGSSTIDFTYVNSNLPKPIDDGCPLGASEVEKTLLEYAMAHPADPYMPEFVKLYGNDTESNPYNQMLYKFRVAKEDFYKNKKEKFILVIDYGEVTSSETTQIDGFGRVTFPKEKLNDILGRNKQEGYIWQVKEAVKSFKYEKLKDNMVVCVYLTGGASRMDFIRQIFMETFNLDEAHCPSDNNPSLIVSQGVAHLSYADAKTQGKKDELKKKAKKIIDDFDWNKHFKEVIYEIVQKGIINKADQIMQAYRKGDIGEWHTLNENGVEGNIYYGPEEGRKKGLTKVRNINALNKEFESQFNSFIHYDFGDACESIIKEKVLNAIKNELKTAFAEFGYSVAEDNIPKIKGLSAKINTNGVNQLKSKFTGGSKGCIVYDAVDSCYMCMVGWNKEKDRWDRDRKQHYEYYRSHYASIYGPYYWTVFLEKNILISGIDGAKKQMVTFIDKMIDDYISYARLSKFF